jgi:cell wall-associated NlpC family hydrolase
MAAAGVAGAADEWLEREPFVEWLAGAATAKRTRDPNTAGVVLVWRDADGVADHAAVTLGSGWALHKPSQGWMSPTLVLPVAALIRSVRLRGLRLHRAAIR